MNPFALPVHPAVVHFPVALLTGAWLCLAAAYARGWPEWERQGRLLETVGVLTLPVAIAAGVVDTRGLGFLVRPRWDLPLIWHALTGVAATAVFAGHLLWSRRALTAGAPDRGPGAAALDLGLVTAGVWLVLVGGLIGAEMVYAA